MASATTLQIKALAQRKESLELFVTEGAVKVAKILKKAKVAAEDPSTAALDGDASLNKLKADVTTAEVSLQNAVERARREIFKVTNDIAELAVLWVDQPLGFDAPTAVLVEHS